MLKTLTVRLTEQDQERLRVWVDYLNCRDAWQKHTASDAVRFALSKNPDRKRKTDSEADAGSED